MIINAAANSIEMNSIGQEGRESSWLWQLQMSPQLNTPLDDIVAF